MALYFLQVRKDGNANSLYHIVCGLMRLHPKLGDIFITACFLPWNTGSFNYKIVVKREEEIYTDNNNIQRTYPKTDCERSRREMFRQK